MLKSLSIKNYAIIEEVEFEFNKNLNIITGETGAGKSIILGALNMVLGARADTKILYDHTRKCVVQADFAISENIKKRLALVEDYDIDENRIVLRREINNKGKSRSFINDTPVTLATLRDTGSLLIDLHQQFDSLDIKDPDMQREYLDAMAGNKQILAQYQKVFHEYKSISTKLKTLRNKGKQSEEELDYLNYQLEELEQANLDSLDLESVEAEYQTLNNAEEIKRILNSFEQVVSLAELNISEQLTILSKDFLSTAKFHPSIANIKERLDDVNDELADLVREAVNLAEDTEYDEAKIIEIKDHLDMIYSLQKKHKSSDTQELINIRDGIKLRINRNDDLDEHIAELEKNLTKCEKELLELSSKLTESRSSVTGTFATEITNILHKLSMPNAEFQVVIMELPEFEIYGRDRIEYQFSANMGIPLNPINQIASGGELSRLALCIKSIIADKTNLPTMVFDEVDSGVSGQVAVVMGQLITDLSQKYQIITITHSPQVAAHGDDHFFIYKEDKNNRSYTKVRKLNQQDRIREIAQMLSGDPPSESAISNARELLHLQGI